MKKGYRKLLLYAGAIVLVLAALVFVQDFLAKKDAEAEAASGRKYAPMAEKDDPLYQKYLELHPEKEILLVCTGDLNEDGENELVVIYRADKSGACESVVLVRSEDGAWYETPPTPAPREHQKMRFFNMDKKDEQELLITGDKDGEVGYAIYRLIDGELINLFGEGMEDCC